MKRYLSLILAMIVASLSSAVARDAASREQLEALVAGLKFQQGTVHLQGDLATLQVPADMRFLNGADAATVLSKLWGNPPESDPLGLLVPNDCNLLADCWAVIITYEAEGYVKDGDAGKINYDDLLKQMQKDAASASKAREQQGYPSIELVGWAAAPRYDRASHKLYWAKNLKFGGENENTLNYNIRVLGRRGVLVLNAVASMSQLPEIEQSTPKILSAIDFDAGNRYVDFSQASGDKIAEYGIGALIAGGVAAKVGLFKGLWVLLLAGKKFVIVAVVAISAWFRKMFGGRKAGPITDATLPPPAAPGSS